MDIEDALIHYGVKGMRWGVTRSDRASRRAASVERRSAPSEVKTKAAPALRGAQAVNVRNAAGGRVAARGGKRNLASKEAVDLAVAKQLAKSSTTNALSNKQLKDSIERMNLEKNFTKLMKDQNKQNRGQRFAQAILDHAGKMAVAELTKPNNSTPPNKRK